MTAAAWQVRTLGPDDAPAFASLLAAVVTPGPRIDRGADPFAHPRSSGEPTYVGAFHERRLVAVAGAVAQTRHVAGAPRRTIYLCDARVAGDFRGTLVLAHVLRALRGALAADAWCHAVVLEANPLLNRLARAMRWFGESRLLGRTRHVAWPVFLCAPSWAAEAAGARLGVDETDADSAAAAYFRWARERDLSPADEARFRAGGRFFVQRRGGAIAAVGKLVDESATRRILADERPSRAAPLLNYVARARRFPALPRPGQAATLSYLAWFASGDGTPSAGFAVAAAAAARTATHVCFGVDASSPAPAHPLAVHFTSRTYGYGDVPASLRMQSHDLTWM